MAQSIVSRSSITAQWRSLGSTASRPGGDSADPGVFHLIGICFLSVGCVVAWRQGAFFTGGLDPVVALKALMQTVALGWAWLVSKRHGVRYPLGIRSLNFLFLILLISVLGAFAGGNLMASVVIAVRIFMMALTIVLVMRSFSTAQTLLALCLCLAIIGVVSSFTGLALGGGSRLSGGIPPLSPNEISLLAGLPALVLLHEGLRARIHWWHLVLLALLVGLLFLSESRTALIGAAAAAGIMLLLVRRFPIQTVITALVGIPVMLYIALLTPALRNIVLRDDSASLLTLNSRTISWSVVLNYPWDSWERWIGSGLSMKTIEVEGQYWEEQVFDSSWISLLAQSGIAGTAIAVLWVLSCVMMVLSTAKLRTLFLPLLTFVLVRSFMENGLIDAGAMFLVFFVLSLSLERPSIAQSLDWQQCGTLNLRESPAREMR